MNVAIITPGRFHSFDLAAELASLGVLGKIYTGYPRFKLKSEDVPAEFVTCASFLHALHMATVRFPLQGALAALQSELYEYARETMDRRIAREINRYDCVIALSGSGLISGRELRRSGGIYICDRASTHITFQDAILKEEAEIVGVKWKPINQRAIARELAEYEAANIILTPSQFTLKTHLQYGVPSSKLRVVPFGVNVRAFRPHKLKAPKFTLLFAGQTTARKGLHYLLSAWRRLAIAGGELRIAGRITAEYEQLVRWAGVSPGNVVMLGHLDKARLAAEMARADALVMPSIEEGLPLVMAQAMACGTAIIGTENTGAESLYKDGLEGFIGPSRSVQFLEHAIYQLSARRELGLEMGRAALARSGTFGDRRSYAMRILDVINGAERG